MGYSTWAQSCASAASSILRSRFVRELRLGGWHGGVPPRDALRSLLRMVPPNENIRAAGNESCKRREDRFKKEIEKYFEPLLPGNHFPHPSAQNAAPFS